MTTIRVLPRLRMPNITWCKTCKTVTSWHWHRVQQETQVDPTAQIEEHLRCDRCGSRYGEKPHVG